MQRTIQAILRVDRSLWINKALLYTCVEMISSVAPYALLYGVIYSLFHASIGLEWIVLWTIGLIAFFILQLVFSMLAQMHVQNEGSQSIQQLRLRLGEHLRTLPMGFFKKKNQGDISQALLTNVDEVELVVTHILPQMIGSIVLCLLNGLLLVWIDWRLALVVLISVPLAVPLLLWSQKVMRIRSRIRHESFVTASGHLQEYIENIQLLKAYQVTGEKFKRLDQALARFRDDSIRVEALASPILYLYAATIEICFIVLLLAGNYLLLEDRLEVSILVIVLIISLQFFKAFRSVGTYMGQMRFMVHAGERIKNVLEEMPLAEPEQQIVPLNNSITFDHVHFGYGNKSILNDVSFHVPERGLVALVGPSGSGKSTVLSLIVRFWDVNQGSVQIGNTDITDISSDELLSRISYVFQDVQLFNDTVIENILMGNRNASFEQVVEAAQLAQCHSFIEKLPHGYETVVGTGGIHLSGGEKQRLSIARAFLKEAPILLLDEVTASLDSENEKLVQRAISKLAQKKTVVVIAHRLKTIQSADHIIVLSDGGIEEQGTHQMLVNGQGLYRHLWQEQQTAGGWKVK